MDPHNANRDRGSNNRVYDVDGVVETRSIVSNYLRDVNPIGTIEDTTMSRKHVGDHMLIKPLKHEAFLNPTQIDPTRMSYNGSCGAKPAGYQLNYDI